MDIHSLTSSRTIVAAYRRPLSAIPGCVVPDDTSSDVYPHSLVESTTTIYAAGSAIALERA